MCRLWEENTEIREVMGFAALRAPRGIADIVLRISNTFRGGACGVSLDEKASGSSVRGD
jgi:hypothetical protein